MEKKKHYFMTCAALLFLGLIVLKPQSFFYPAESKQVEKKIYEQRIRPIVEFEYE